MNKSKLSLSLTMPLLLLSSYVSYAEPNCASGTIEYIRFDRLEGNGKDVMVIKLSSMDHEAYSDDDNDRQPLLYMRTRLEKK